MKEKMKMKRVLPMVISIDVSFSFAEKVEIFKAVTGTWPDREVTEVVPDMASRPGLLGLRSQSREREVEMM